MSSNVSFYAGAAALGAVGAICLRRAVQGPDCPDQCTKLDGKTVVITGANTGIGFETALELVARRARVIIACRDVIKGEAAAARIRQTTGCAADAVVVRSLDLCSFASIRRFAEQVLREERRLDILINNAGCVLMQHKITEDGIESQFQSNHFGHFLLTSLLLPLLKKSGPSRIINVSSKAHYFTNSISFADINHEKSSYLGPLVYGQTKLANILFTRELAERLKGTGVTVNCLHPGTVDTEFPRHLPWFVRTVYPIFAKLIMKGPRKGAQTSIWAAVDPQFAERNGEYLSGCAITQPSASARDAGMAKKLWELSEKLTGAEY